MSPTRLYSAAPIVEAVAEVRFAAPINARAIKRYVSTIKGYTENLRQEIRQVKISVPTSQASFASQGDQYRLSNEDLTECLIINSLSIVISQSAPYTSWENFNHRISRDLFALQKLTTGRKVERIGLRYINRIDFVGDHGVVPNNYLNVGWATPPEFGDPQITSLHYQFSLEDLGCKLILKAGTTNSEVPALVATILDIDLVVDDDPPQAVEDIVAKFADLRMKKNQVFEDCITNAARERFG
ncbi:MAG: TIGR04255 family protein [Sphingomonas sp.]|uniref:TIGR04255 family protein n=1 Tax=Sphingomonas sp. TaxID=28214 RepID=UPI0026029D00|nr:TIGR04255 family protein [Sphingomonas sp.]MDK2769812.1 TIGR04255 family protein [Sphingomonas sp.]